MFPAANQIVVVGSSGSGKTSLAEQLTYSHKLPFYDLDDFYWLPQWKLRDKEEFRQLIDQTTSQEKWVISGNQSTHRDLLWPRADLVIWLDVPPPHASGGYPRGGFGTISPKPPSATATTIPSVLSSADT